MIVFPLILSSVLAGAQRWQNDVVGGHPQETSGNHHDTPRRQGRVLTRQKSDSFKGGAADAKMGGGEVVLSGMAKECVYDDIRAAVGFPLQRVAARIVQDNIARLRLGIMKQRKRKIGVCRRHPGRNLHCCRNTRPRRRGELRGYFQAAGKGTA